MCPPRGREAPDHCDLRRLYQDDYVQLSDCQEDARWRPTPGAPHGTAGLAFRYFQVNAIDSNLRRATCARPPIMPIVAGRAKQLGTTKDNMIVVVGSYGVGLSIAVQRAPAPGQILVGRDFRTGHGDGQAHPVTT